VAYHKYYKTYISKTFVSMILTTLDVFTGGTAPRKHNY